MPAAMHASPEAQLTAAHRRSVAFLSPTQQQLLLPAATPPLGKTVTGRGASLGAGPLAQAQARQGKGEADDDHRAAPSMPAGQLGKASLALASAALRRPASPWCIAVAS